MLNLKFIICLSILTIISVIVAAKVLAGCPEGKSPVYITTPSGIDKTLCIPETAIQGIENAAENSSGTINPSVTCPCWSAGELEDAAAADPAFYCKLYGIDVEYKNNECFLNDGNSYADLILVSIGGKGACVNYFTGDKISDFSKEEFDECYNLLVPYSPYVK